MTATLERPVAGMNGGEGANVYGSLIRPMMGGSTTWEILMPPDNDDEEEDEETKEESK